MEWSFLCKTGCGLDELAHLFLRRLMVTILVLEHRCDCVPGMIYIMLRHLPSSIALIWRTKNSSAFNSALAIRSQITACCSDFFSSPITYVNCYSTWLPPTTIWLWLHEWIVCKNHLPEKAKGATLKHPPFFRCGHCDLGKDVMSKMRRPLCSQGHWDLWGTREKLG